MTVSKPLGVGLIGCGGFGRFVLAAVADVPGADVRAINDVDPDHAGAVAARSAATAITVAGQVARANRGLTASGAATVIDVRRYPAGRRQPRFARERLEADLPALGISYEWWGEALGGRRPMPEPPPADSRWRTHGFVAYAAHMHSDAFRTALAAVEARARAGEALAIMCAETRWWRCHRRLIADALVFDGFAVRHLIDQLPGVAHEISEASAIMMGQR